ncbi:MAG: YfhO family protein [Planctomycetota bacterium]|nr:YfhO family protein [Planctomycetota bacterium]
MERARIRDARWIAGGGLLLILLLFGKGGFGQVPTPTDLLFNWYPWKSDAAEGMNPQPMLLDGVIQVYPWYGFARDEIRSGRLPLWNPYASCGLPHAANPVTAVFSPFSIPLWIFSFPVALYLLHAAKVFLAWTFMALYLRHRGLARLPSALGAVAFALSGYVIGWMFWPLSSTFIWLPVLLLFSERVMDRASIRDVTVLGVLGGLCFLSGHPETTFYIGFLLAMIGGGTLTWGVLRKRRTPKNAGAALSRLALAVVLAVSISAIVLIPFIEYLDLSEVARYRESLPTNPFVLRPDTFLLHLVPGFFGDVLHRQFWFTKGSYVELAQGYFGLVPFVLSLIGVALAYRRRDAGRIGLSLSALVVLSVIYGIPPLHGWITLLPGFDVAPNHRMLCLVIFLGIVLGAGALNTILEDRQEDRRPLRDASILAGAVVMFLLTLLPVVVVLTPGNYPPGVLSVPIDSAGAPRWMVAHLILALCLAGAFLIFLGFRLAGRLPLRWFRWIVGFLVVADLAWFAVPYNPMAPPGKIYPAHPTTTMLAEKAGTEFRVTGALDHLPVGTNLPYRLQEVRGYDGMSIARYEDVRKILTGPQNILLQVADQDLPLLDFLNVRYLVREPGTPLPGTVPGGEEVSTGGGPRFSPVEGHSVIENLRALPRAFLVRRIIDARGGAESLELIRDGRVDFRNEVILESLAETAETPEPPAAPLPEGAPEGEVRVTNYLPREVRVSVEANPAPAILVMSDTHYPGWRATIGGQETPILLANHAFRAVKVPAGSYEVVFRFDPKSFTWGAWITALALLLSVALLLWTAPAIRNRLVVQK